MSFGRLGALGRGFSRLGVVPKRPTQSGNPSGGNELREDGSVELREDGFKELRE
jgi:hypothetical protein